MIEDTTTTGARAIPRRMHLPYAHAVARRGYSIRRAGWSDKWLRLVGGLWWMIDAGAKRIARSSDMTEEAMLAWDWTTQASSCDATPVELTPAEMADLLRVRPFTGLATAADPLGMGCALPVMDVLGGPQVSAVAFPGMPPAEDPVTGLITFAEVENPLLLPAGTPRAQWQTTTKRKLIPPAPPTEPPALAVMFSVTNRISEITSGTYPAGCIPGPVTDNVQCQITSGFVHFTGGPAGAQYSVQVKIFGGELGSGGYPLVIAAGGGTTITVDADELTAWQNPPGTAPGIGLAPNQVLTMRAVWSRVGGGASGQSAAVTITVPPFCDAGSGA